MTMPGQLVLEASLAAAVSATQAGRGWIVAAGDGSLEVVASTMPTAPSHVAVEGSAAGYVTSLRQPLAVVLRSPDQFPADVAVADGGAAPTSVLCVPCEHEDRVVGALELVDARSGSFSFDDVEMVTLLAGIVGAALAELADAGTGDSPRLGPMQAGDALVRVADRDPALYRAVASLIDALTDG